MFFMLPLRSEVREASRWQLEPSGLFCLLSGSRSSTTATRRMRLRIWAHPTGAGLWVDGCGRVALWLSIRQTQKRQ